MKQQHTPGPWRVDGEDTLAKGTQHRLRIWTDAEGNRELCAVIASGLQPETNRANACLMAAAPQLLAQLRALVADVEAMQFPLRDTEGDPAAHDADRRDYFGAFTNYYDEHDQTMCEGAGVRVCWPNLRILLDQARATLAAIDKEGAK